MVSQESQEFAGRAELFYRQRLKDQLEQSHRDQFVAIEPQSGDYFLGGTLAEAIRAARKTHPDRLAHVIRVGHPEALCVGAFSR